MADLVVKASSDDAGLRRESTIDAAGLPLWLSKLHSSLPAKSVCRITVEGDLPMPLSLLFEGAGFSNRSGDEFTREPTLPDMVAPGMRFLVCGLNPSLHSANAGVGFVTKSNRFWPAALAAGIISSDRNPLEALTLDNVGFTDLAKRATARADELTKSEFEAGLSRLERLSKWLQPKTIIMVGLSGWRSATTAKAATGWQPEALGGCPVYLMPNTSGINTHSTLADLTTHITEAASGP